MSLFESSITGNVLNDGSSTEISSITAGQLATVLTAYTPFLAPYALAADLASVQGSIAANQSSITALNTSLVTSLAGKANQSALDALLLEVGSKSTRGRKAGQLLQHGGHELGHRQCKQRRTGDCGEHVRPPQHHRPAGPGPRGQAVGARCDSKIARRSWTDPAAPRFGLK